MIGLVNRHIAGFGVLVLFGGLAITAHGGDGQMTLQEAVTRGLALDPTVRKIFSAVPEAEGYRREVRADLLPQLTLEGGAGYAKRDRSIDGVATGGEDLFSRQVGLVFEQLLFDGGYHWYRWEDADERLKATKLLDVAQRERTAFGIVEAYLSVLRAREQIDLAVANLEIHERVRGLSVDRAKAAGNQADVDLSNARMDLARTLVLERELDLKQAELMFYRYVGEYPPTLVPPKVPGIQSLGEIDVTQNFHYRAALHQREAATLAKKAVEKRYFPRVIFRGTGSVGEDVLGIRGEDDEVSAMIFVQWDLFDSGRRKGLIEQALADIDRQQAVIDETAVLLVQDIQSRWEDYSSVGDRIEVLKAYHGELGKTVKLYEEQFDLGTRPLLSMLDIQNEEIGAAIRLVDEQFDYELNAYRLLFFGGRLIADTAGVEYLETPEKTADDDEYEVHPWALRPNPNPDPASSAQVTMSSEAKTEAPAAEAGETSSRKRGLNLFGFLKKSKAPPAAVPEPTAESEPASAVPETNRKLNLFGFLKKKNEPE